EALGVDEHATIARFDEDPLELGAVARLESAQQLLAHAVALRLDATLEAAPDRLALAIARRLERPAPYHGASALGRLGLAQRAPPGVPDHARLPYPVRVDEPLGEHGE